jgi:hypothetical protein
MQKIALIAAASLLLLGTASWAAENSGASGTSGNTPRMQGSPSAETTGTAGSQRLATQSARTEK